MSLANSNAEIANQIKSMAADRAGMVHETGLTTWGKTKREDYCRRSQTRGRRRATHDRMIVLRRFGCALTAVPAGWTGPGVAPWIAKRSDPARSRTPNLHQVSNRKLWDFAPGPRVGKSRPRKRCISHISGSFVAPGQHPHYKLIKCRQLASVFCQDG